MKAIIESRALQLLYHNCHLLAYGQDFISIHSFLGDNYGRLESDFDSLSEYFIASIGPSSYDTIMIQEMLHEVLERYKVEQYTVVEMLQTLVMLESQYKYTIFSINQTAFDIGLQNLLGDVAQAQNTRLYKLNQILRVK